VYVLRSIEFPVHEYVGLTDDPRRRLAEHNAEKSRHTAKFASWRLEVIVGFADACKAEEFERYLKHGSGHAFRKRHF
jgi:putative endonuclease